MIRVTTLLISVFGAIRYAEIKMCECIIRIAIRTSPRLSLGSEEMINRVRVTVGLNGISVIEVTKKGFELIGTNWLNYFLQTTCV